MLLKMAPLYSNEHFLPKKAFPFLICCAAHDALMSLFHFLSDVSLKWYIQSFITVFCGEADFSQIAVPCLATGTN